MRNNTPRLAWVVLLISFSICLLLVFSGPVAARWFFAHSAADEPALLRVTSGTMLLLTPGSGDPRAVVDSREVDPGTLIQSDQSAQGSLSFTLNGVDSSPEVATVQIYPTVQLELARNTRPRFGVSNDPRRVAIEVRNGRVRINTAEVLPAGLQFTVVTPQALIDLGPGSFAVQVDDDKTQVISRYGQATVEGDGETVVITEGVGTEVLTGAAPGQPAAPVDNLIVNGDFEEPLGPPEWLVTRYPEDDPNAGQAEIVSDSGRNVVRFSRINQPPTHTEIGITQVLGRDVLDYEMVNLQLDVNLHWQSLPGAGEQSSEFPLMFRLDYEDIYGNHQFWTHGFYYRDPPDQWVVTGGEQIPQDTWFPFESGNLAERLQLQGLSPPAKLNYLKIYASGHNYDSMVAEVRIVAR
ncbi:MAG: hypothetical protein KDI03_09065 [Anaerolineae bacterium]|nr:hypothetical protein [Anaerolineae bacterium]